MKHKMVTAVKNQAPAPRISDTSKASLCSLTRRMGDLKSFRNPDSLRSELRRLGDVAAVRAELRAVIAGPPKATVRDFAGQLGKLALHFWRPDFTPDQAKLLYGDFIHDLNGVTALELAGACEEWRTDPLNNFYPTPGKLLEPVKDALNDRARARIGAEYLLELLGDDKPAGDAGRAFDPAAELRALGDKMRVKSGSPAPIATESEIPAVLSTARATTDAAELLNHIKGKAYAA